MRPLRLLTFAVFFLLNRSSLACPFCDNETAQETRAGIFNDQFVPNLFAGLLPFVIVAGIALAIHVDWSNALRRHHRSETTP